MTINCGVPQDSVLEPVLLIIYMNDISKCLKMVSFILFADDKNLFHSHKSADVLCNTRIKNFGELRLDFLRISSL